MSLNGVAQGVRVYESLRAAEMDRFRFYDRQENSEFYLVRRAKDDAVRPNQTRFELALARK